MTMSHKIDQAIEAIRKLPQERQDEIAEILLVMGGEGSVHILSDQERAAIEEAREEVARNGVASEEDVAAMWKKHGL